VRTYWYRDSTRPLPGLESRGLRFIQAGAFFITEAAIDPNAQGLETSVGAVARLSGDQPRISQTPV
jgi:hypothetical protein